MAPLPAASRGTLAGLLGGSRMFQYLTAAAPGLTELVTMGKVWDLAQLERAHRGRRVRPGDRGRPRHRPRAGDAARAAHLREHRAGGARSAARRRAIDAFLRDPDATGVLAVALPEEMPGERDVELERAAAATSSAWTVDAIVVNAVHPAAVQRRRRRAGSSAADGQAARRARCDRGGAVRAPARPRRARAGAAAAARRDARPWSRSRTCSSRSSARASSSGCRVELERRL